MAIEKPTLAAHLGYRRHGLHVFNDATEGDEMKLIRRSLSKQCLN